MLKNIPIKNGLYGSYLQPNKSIIYSIKSMGFYILTYLIYKSDGTDYVDITKGNISDYLNIDMRTVNKYLLLLEKNNLISCEKDILKKNRNTLLEISLKEYNALKGGYELIPSELFTKNRKTISDKGWLVLCLITKTANFDLGSGIGMAYTNMSREYLAKQIGVNREIITIHTNILQEQKLIQIVKSKNIPNEDREGYHYISKIYKVPFKVDTRKGKKNKIPENPI